MHRSLHFSSKNREKIGMSEPNDVTIKFNPVLNLSKDMRHELILMTYSWHNITTDYENNPIKYSPDGRTWETITFVDGMYSYTDLDNHIHEYLKTKGHYKTVKEKEIYDINI